MYRILKTSSRRYDSPQHWTAPTPPVLHIHPSVRPEHSALSAPAGSLSGSTKGGRLGKLFQSLYNMKMWMTPQRTTCFYTLYCKLVTQLTKERSSNSCPMQNSNYQDQGTVQGTIGFLLLGILRLDDTGICTWIHYIEIPFLHAT